MLIWRIHRRKAKGVNSIRAQTPRITIKPLALPYLRKKHKQTNQSLSTKNVWYVQQLHYFHSPFASYPGMYPKELRTTLNRLQDIRKKQIQVVRTKDPFIADYLATTLAVTVHCTRLFSMMYFNRRIFKDSLDWPALLCLGKDVGHERAKAFNGSFWNKTR